MNVYQEIAESKISCKQVLRGKSLWLVGKIICSAQFFVFDVFAPYLEPLSSITLSQGKPCNFYSFDCGVKSEFIEAIATHGIFYQNKHGDA